jgi:hypothetical protein
MTWFAGQRTVADVTGVVVTGAHAAGGAHIYMDVSFRLTEWPWEEKGPASLIPQPSEVIARVAGGELRLGFATPAPAAVFVPPGNSSVASVRFTLALSTSALVELEAARNGGGLELSMSLVAHPLLVSQYTSYPPGVAVFPASENYAFKVPKEHWIAVLENTGFCRTLVTELRLPASGPDSTLDARLRLANAVKARNNGSHGESLRLCRTAIDALKKRGFGGKAPKDVVQFLKDKGTTMSYVERVSALQVALELFLSQAHHANEHEDHYCREDAELAIAMTAALVRIAANQRVDGGEPSRGDSDL